MKEADAELFISALQKEISDHELLDHWSIVKRSTIPSTAKTIQAIWSFKQKRFTDGCLNKHKARLPLMFGCKNGVKNIGKHTAQWLICLLSDYF